MDEKSASASKGESPGTDVELLGIISLPVGPKIVSGLSCGLDPSGAAAAVIEGNIRLAAIPIGIAFSALPVFIYQGIITLLATTIEPYLTDPIIWEMTATGGLLIIGISTNILGIKNIKVANLLPGIVVAAGLAHLVVNYFPQFYS